MKMECYHPSSTITKSYHPHIVIKEPTIVIASPITWSILKPFNIVFSLLLAHSLSPWKTKQLWILLKKQSANESNWAYLLFWVFWLFPPQLFVAVLASLFHLGELLLCISIQKPSQQHSKAITQGQSQDIKFCVTAECFYMDILPLANFTFCLSDPPPPGLTPYSC